jgi:hypothetical protein
MIKTLAVVVCAFLVACASSRPTRTEPEVALTYTVKHGRIDLTATVTPSSSRPTFFVHHPDFVRLMVTPQSTESSEYVSGGVVSWLAPTSDELVSASSAHPAVFTASIPYSRKPDGRLLLGTDSTTYHPPAYLVRGRKIQVEFRYDIDESQLPVSWRLRLQPLYRGSLSARLPFTLL